MFFTAVLLKSSGSTDYKNVSTKILIQVVDICCVIDARMFKKQQTIINLIRKSLVTKVYKKGN